MKIKEIQQKLPKKSVGAYFCAPTPDESEAALAKLVEQKFSLLRLHTVPDPRPGPDIWPGVATIRAAGLRPGLSPAAAPGLHCCTRSTDPAKVRACVSWPGGRCPGSCAPWLRWIPLIWALVARCFFCGGIWWPVVRFGPRIKSQ